jgi:hypothetical protein
MDRDTKDLWSSEKDHQAVKPNIIHLPLGGENDANHIGWTPIFFF